MVLITAERTAHYRKLADDADAALARGDDMGMELLRALVPELTDAVEEINDGLREAVSLLFEGLRDEAIGLHDAALPETAIRLHLADKPQWPPMELHFQAAQIALPPAVDFEALSTLNAAFAEVERLRKPLDKLRRLTLQRAPLTERIQLLRGIRKIDSSMPVWCDQVVALEKARLAELASEVSAAVKASDAERLAACEAEVMSPEWSVPVSGRLAEQVQGAGAWQRLRLGLRELESLAPAIEQEFAPIAAGDDPLADPARVDLIRQLCSRFVRAESECRDVVFALPQHPVVSKLANAENLGPRVEMFRGRIGNALAWTAAVEADEHMLDSFRRQCDELRTLAARLPDAKNAAAWRVRVADAEASLEQMLVTVPGLVRPLDIGEKLAVARAKVRSIERIRSLALAAMIGAACLVCAGIAVVAWRRLEASARREQAMQELEKIESLARRGELGGLPGRAAALADAVGKDQAMVELLETIDGLVTVERFRRSEFDAMCDEVRSALAFATDAVETRQTAHDAKLEQWPREFFEAESVARRARLRGGYPHMRRDTGGAALPSVDRGTRPADAPPEAVERFAREEAILAELFRQIGTVGKGFATAAQEEFVRQVDAIKEEAGAVNAGDADAVVGLQQRLDRLVEKAKASQHVDFTKRSRVPVDLTSTAEPVRQTLERLARTSAAAPN